jgi:two-component system sensor kinase FixL
MRNLTRTSGLYHAMLETATDPIVLIDTKGIVCAASRSCETMFGWPRTELIGQNVSVLMTEPHRSEHDGYLRRYLETGHSSVLGNLREFVVRRRDQSLITVELSAFRLAIADDDQPVFCGFFRDISERKRVEAREAAHLAALGTIAESASMLAHELKNPITGLRHALRAVGDQLGASEQDIIGELADRMQRLERRLRRTLQFVRSPEVQREHCDATKLVHDVACDLRQVAEAKAATIEIDGGSAGHAAIDAPLIQDVLLNLLTNALDAVPEGGLVRVRVTARGDGLEIRVEDDGDGIPPSIRDQLFHPFTTSKATGTGLGLMICKRIVEAHGGDIRVDRSDLGGAAFVLNLPGGA